MKRFVLTTDGRKVETPYFLPVYKLGNEFITIDELQDEFKVKGIITNAFFLYKEKEYKQKALENGIKSFFKFNGLIMTDSGAFQGFTRPLYLDNRKIIKFEQEIGADVISPLDLVSPPWEKRKLVEEKLQATMKRMEEGMEIVNKSILAGVQQGGKFLDLRDKSIRHLAALGCKYIALGSLVPFFNKEHDMSFVTQVIEQSRKILPFETPIHLFGAGDPVEIPFYMMLGCDIFDSSSYIHYANDGWYMTPFGSLRGREEVILKGYECNCPYCVSGLDEVFNSPKLLAVHNLWTILDTLKSTYDSIINFTLSNRLEQISTTNNTWFPGSKLKSSWKVFANRYKILEEALDKESSQICKIYKIDRQIVIDKLHEAFYKTPKLFDKLNETKSLKNLERLSIYKDMIKMVKKDVYFSLRQYHSDFVNLDTLQGEDKFNSIVLSHISTKERLLQKGDFNNQLEPYIKDAQNILDIGSGVYPIIFPYDKAFKLENYIAVDKDVESIENINEYAKTNNTEGLKGIERSIKNSKWSFYLPEGVKEFDTVFMFKLIPVIARQERRLLQSLAQIPAKIMIITASKEAMVKKKDISKREDKVLMDFVKLSEREIIGKIDIENEFGYVLK